MMPKPKVYIYTPVDQTGTSHNRIIDAGCELRLGEATWQNIATGRVDYHLRFAPDTSVLAGVAARRMPNHLRTRRCRSSMDSVACGRRRWCWGR